MPDVPLPNWVYDLVNELDEQRETHPKLLFTSGGFQGTAQYNWCPCEALKRVPDDALDRARAIAAYWKNAQHGPDRPAEVATDA